MKKIVTLTTTVLLSAALAFGTATAVAGDRGHHGDGPKMEKMLERMGKKLDLDEAQMTQVEEIMQSHQAEFDALKADREAMRERAQALRATVSEEVKAVLTPEQVEKLEKMEERRGHRGGDRDGHHKDKDKDHDDDDKDHDDDMDKDSDSDGDAS